MHIFTCIDLISCSFCSWLQVESVNHIANMFEVKLLRDGSTHRAQTMVSIVHVPQGRKRWQWRWGCRSG